LANTPYPRRGDRGGDTLNGSIPVASRRGLSLKKGSSGMKERHQSTSLTGGQQERPGFDARTTGFFAVEDNTSCDFILHIPRTKILLHYL